MSFFKRFFIGDKIDPSYEAYQRQQEIFSAVCRTTDGLSLLAYSRAESGEAVTSSDVDVHTIAFDELTEAYHKLCSADSQVNVNSELGAIQKKLHRSCTDLYAYAVKAYNRTCSSATMTALQGQLQMAKDDVEIFLLRAAATNSNKCAEEKNALERRADVWSTANQDTAVQLERLLKNGKFGESASAAELRRLGR